MSVKWAMHMTKSIDNKCFMNVLGRFWSFSPKMSKQIVHPIYRVSQLHLLYLIILKKIAQYTALVLRNNHDTWHFSLRTYSVSYTVWQKMHFYFSPGQMNFIYLQCVPSYRPMLVNVFPKISQSRIKFFKWHPYLVRQQTKITT